MGGKVKRLLFSTALVWGALIEPAFADPVTLTVAAITSGITASGSILAGTLTLGFSIGSAVIGAGLAAVAALLTPKPKPQGGFQIPEQGYTQQFRQAVAPRKIVYGECRVSGNILYIGTTNSNKYLHMVIELASHEIEEIGEIWVNDYSIAPDHLDGDGTVNTGRYEDIIRFKKYLGTAAQSADSDLVSEVSEWTTDHKLSGIAYIYVRMKWDRDKFPSGIPNVSAWVKGKKIYDTRDAGTRFTSNLGLIAYDYLTDDLGLGASIGSSIATEYADPLFADSSYSDPLYADNSYSDALYASKTTSDTIDDTLIGTFNLCEEYVDVTSINYNVTSVDTTNDILTLDEERLTLVFGDKIQIATGVIGGLSAGTDYYVVPYQRKDTVRIKLASSLANAIAGTFIDLTSGTTATIQKVAEPRYFGGGIIKLDSARDENFREILKCMAGQAVYAGGGWRILGGEYQSPTISFDESDFASGIEISPKISKKDRCNRVQGVYISPYNNDNPADYPLVKNSTYETNDGLILKKDLDLAFVQRPHHAQRVAKIYLERARQDVIFKASFKLTAFKVQVGDNFYLSFDRFGWTNKIFEVISWELSLSDGSPVINMTCRENASGVYDWNNGEETAVDLAPNTSLDSPFTVEVVTGFSLDSILVNTQSSDKVFNVKASWDEHPNEFVLSGGRFEIQYKETTDTVYNSAGKVDGNVNEMILPVLKPDVLYDIRIFAYNNLDVRSAATTINNFQVGTTVTTNTEDWENETLARDGDDWETDTLSTEDWE